MKPDKPSTPAQNCPQFETIPWHNPNYPKPLPGSQPTLNGLTPKEELSDQTSDQTSEKTS